MAILVVGLCVVSYLGGPCRLAVVYLFGNPGTLTQWLLSRTHADARPHRDRPHGARNLAWNRV